MVVCIILGFSPFPAPGQAQNLLSALFQTHGFEVGLAFWEGDYLCLIQM